MASRALSAEVEQGVLQLLVSASRQSSSGRQVRTSMVSPRCARAGLARPASRLTSTGFGLSGWRRAKASRRWVRPRLGGARHGARGEALHRCCSAPSAARASEVAHDGRQQIVEVVRDAAGELADRLHLLRLTQLLLGALALGDSRAARCFVASSSARSFQPPRPSRRPVTRLPVEQIALKILILAPMPERR